MAESQGSIDTARAGVAVAALTGLGAFGPAMGLSAAWIVVLVGGVLVALSVDAATWQGMGGTCSRKHCRVVNRDCAELPCTRQGMY